MLTIPFSDLHKRSNNQWLLETSLLLIYFIIFSLFSVPYSFADDKQSLEQPSEISVKQTNAKARYLRSIEKYTIPDVILTDMEGKRQSFKNLLGSNKPIFLNFIFTTCPSFCPLLSATFSQLQGHLMKEPVKPLMFSISIDPENDTPEKLRNYAKKFKAGPNWIFLTGTFDNIKAIEHAFNAYRGEKMNHVPLTYLRKPGQPYWIRLDGFSSAKDLLDEYHQVLNSNKN
ncbi:MAG: SCO family protein [Methylococcales bacterium]